MDVATVLKQETTKVKPSDPAGAKVDGDGMVSVQKLLIMAYCTQRRWTTRICFTNNGTKPLIITQGSCGCTDLISVPPEYQEGDMPKNA
jgi:hypothetical protein